MALDAAALALCAKELSAALADARIDKIFEPTRDEVVLNLRTRTDNPRLFLSARSGSARACLTKETFENPQTPPSFCMLLRKHFTGGRLLEARTLPDERILFFDFQCTNEMGDTVVNTMAAELTPAQAGGAPSTVEELKQYKALLDAGVLTEEEFAAKKRQLLGI